MPHTQKKSNAYEPYIRWIHKNRTNCLSEISQNQKMQGPYRAKP